jgi:hypothetical protein
VETIEGAISVIKGISYAMNLKALETAMPLLVTNSKTTDETGSDGVEHCTEEPET